MQLSHKLHSIFVWNCRTAVKPYKLVEISVLFSKLSQNHLQFNAKKGILKEKEKRKNGQKGEVEHMKEKGHKNLAKAIESFLVEKERNHSNNYVNVV